MSTSLFSNVRRCVTVACRHDPFIKRYFVTTARVMLPTQQLMSRLDAALGATGSMSSFTTSKEFDSSHSNYSVANFAQEFGREYSESDDERRKEIMLGLARFHGLTDLDDLQLSIQRYKEFEKDDEARRILLSRKLLETTLPRYVHLFRAIAQLPEGIKLLVDMRDHVLTTQEEIKLKPDEPNDVPRLRLLQESLRDILSICFSTGLLKLHNVTWNSSCDLLEKIAMNEAVHQVKSWADLKQRVGPNRRVFVYQHPCMGDDPIVILHVALMQKICSSMQEVLWRYLESPRRSPSLDAPIEDPSKIQAAVFYSISSVHKGLQSIDLGHSLIQRVVTQLQRDMPQIDSFSSLSPITGFREWLLSILSSNKDTNKAHIQRLLSAIPVEQMTKLNQLSEQSGLSTSAYLMQTLTEDKHGWIRQPGVVAVLEPFLRKAAAVYVYHQKRRGYALNSVANFHLRNGAVFWRLCWMGDPSARGLSQSFGMMVNYRYYIEELDRNSENYLRHGDIKTGETVQSLVLDWEPKM